MTGSRHAWPVELLADHAGCVDVLADWFAQEWAPYYGPGGAGDARADLAAIRDGRVLGTAALDRDTATGPTPSVVGLLVAPDCRGRGVASALLESAERLAGQLGYDELFMSTSVLQVLLQRNGWQQTGDVEFLNNERGKVFVRHLTKSEST
jgi:GNAT superfamily N-acetyltransferase